MTEVIAPMVTVTPGPYEIAVARVPAGSAFRWPLRAGFTDTVPACDETRWMQCPGAALGFWGADLTTCYTAHAIGLGRKKADRAVWQRAARMLPSGAKSAVVYVLLEETKPYGRPVWLAVSIRTEEPGDD